MRRLDKKQWIAVTTAFVVVTFFFFFQHSILNIFNTQSTNITTMTTSGMTIVDTTIGTGAEALSGKQITVDYTGKFTNGTVFDSSIPRGTPFTFLLGAGQVITGWERGMVGMKVGGTRVLTIPPALGYGPNDYGPIPGGSTLIFEVKLLDVK